MFAADPLLCRDKGRWSSTTKVAEMAAPPGTFFNSIPSLRIYRNTQCNYVCNTSIHFLDVIQFTYQSILKRWLFSMLGWKYSYHVAAFKCGAWATLAVDYSRSNWGLIWTWTWAAQDSFESSVREKLEQLWGMKVLNHNDNYTLCQKSYFCSKIEFWWILANHLIWIFAPKFNNILEFYILKCIQY